MNSAVGTSNNSSSSQTAIEALGLYTPEKNYYDNWSFNTSGDDYYSTTSGGYQYRRYTHGIVHRTTAQKADFRRFLVNGG